MDQGRQAGGEDDAAELPSLSVERGAALAECDRLRGGQPVATASVAEEDWELVADELAAAAGKTGGRLVRHARYYWLLLAEGHLSRRLFRQHAEKDRGVAAAFRKMAKTSRTTTAKG